MYIIIPTTREKGRWLQSPQKLHRNIRPTEILYANSFQIICPILVLRNLLTKFRDNNIRKNTADQNG